MEISSLINLIIYLLVGGILIYIVLWIVGMFALPQPVRNAIVMIIALIVLLWILRTFGIF